MEAMVAKCQYYFFLVAEIICTYGALFVKKSIFIPDLLLLKLARLRISDWLLHKSFSLPEVELLKF